MYGNIRSSVSCHERVSVLPSYAGRAVRQCGGNGHLFHFALWPVIAHALGFRAVVGVYVDMALSFACGYSRCNIRSLLAPPIVLIVVMMSGPALVFAMETLVPALGQEPALHILLR